MTSRLTCELVTDFPRLEEFAAEWSRLHATTRPAGGVFQRWGWARAFWTTYGDTRSLCTPVIFDGSRVVGILPLAFDGEVASLLGAPHTDYNGMLCAVDAAPAVMTTAIRALAEAPFDWVECVLDGIPEGSASWHAALAGGHGHEQMVFGSRCPIALDDTGTVFARLIRKESLRRHEKRLSARGAVRFRHVEDREEIRAHLDRFADWHITRHAASGTASPLARPRGRAMLDALVSELDPARELRFAVLDVDGRPVAYHLGFEEQGRFTYYMPAFDADHHADGPGEVMLKRLLQYAHARGLAEFDFTIGDEPYKMRFATHVRRTFTVYLYRDPHAVMSTLHRLARDVRDSARRQPAVVACARPVLEAARRVRARLLPEAS